MKWEGFLKSMDNSETFEVFVQSLKEIKEEKKIEPTINPENENGGEEKEKRGRSSSCKKIPVKQDKNEVKARNLNEKIS